MSVTVPTFSLAYTSVRPQMMRTLFETWNARAILNQHEWVISVDGGDQASIDTARELSQVRPGVSAVIQTMPPFNCVRGWNLAAEHTTGKVIIAVADDFSPPAGWDKALLDLKPGWEDEEWVVHTEDGYVHDIFVLGIVTRKRYEKFGYIFYSEYESMFSDTELTMVAHRDGVVLEAPQLLFEHQHPDCGKRARDHVDAKHASTDRWNRGQMLFNFRKAQGFPLDAGPKAAAIVSAPAAVVAAPALPAPVPGADGFAWAAYLQVTKDDFCLFEVCQRLVEEGVKAFFFAVPDEYWNGTVTPESDIEQVRRTGQLLTEANQGQVTCNIRVFDVSACRFTGDTRLRTETRVRNDSLAWIRSYSYRHILIVDGDELWLQGTLATIATYVKQGVLTISSPMVPVIGLPGYPVDRATDTAVVYIGGNAIFQECRSPHIKPVQLSRPHVMHFTATRKTMEEIVVKLRQSGHYDDPQYLFEEFIEKVLPNIKPGFTHKWPTGHVGLHFYLPYQIWNSVRQWRPEELVHIPKSIWPYLALPKELLEGSQDNADGLVQTQTPGCS